MATSSPLSAPCVGVSLPHELLERIFSVCNPPTLAAVAAVDLACLELSSRYLYDDIVLTKPSAIIKLFRLQLLVEGSYPTSDRVSRQTRLDRVHSVTLLLAEFIFNDPLAGWARLPPPVPISIFVISVPQCWVDPHWENEPAVSYASPLLRLVNPTTLIVLEHPTPNPYASSPNSEAGRSWVDLTAYQDGRPQSAPPWDRLATVILSTALVEAPELFGRDSVTHHSLAGHPSTRVIVDLVDLELEANGEFDVYSAADGFNELSWHNFAKADERRELRAWVGSQEAKDALERLILHSKCASPEALGKSTFVDVASPEVHLLRKQIARGVWKGMDFAALEIGA